MSKLLKLLKLLTFVNLIAFLRPRRLFGTACLEQASSAHVQLLPACLGSIFGRMRLKLLTESSLFSWLNCFHPSLLWSLGWDLNYSPTPRKEDGRTGGSGEGEWRRGIIYFYNACSILKF